MVVKRYQELESDPTAFEAFIEQQKALASQMMKVGVCSIIYLLIYQSYLQDAIILNLWVLSSKKQRAIDDDQNMENRQARLVI